MKRFGLALVLAALMTPLLAAPAHALDLFPDVDLIPDPNLEDLNDIPDFGPGYGGGSTAATRTGTESRTGTI